jgi:hypothetical protein
VCGKKRCGDSGVNVGGGQSCPAFLFTTPWKGGVNTSLLPILRYGVGGEWAARYGTRKRAGAFAEGKEAARRSRKTERLRVRRDTLLFEVIRR